MAMTKPKWPWDTSVPEDPPVGDFGGGVRSWGVGLRDGEVTTAGSPKECRSARERPKVWVGGCVCVCIYMCGVWMHVRTYLRRGAALYIYTHTHSYHSPGDPPVGIFDLAACGQLGGLPASVPNPLNGEGQASMAADKPK